jgi:multimeric flavodoxin WrbA
MKQEGFIGIVSGMSILLILDRDSKSPLSEGLRARVCGLAHKHGLAFEKVELARENVPPCTGCFQCITKHPGRCIHQQAFSGLVEKALHRRIVIFLTPARFGTFCSTIKNVVDRGGLILRDHKTCTQVMIGYGEDLVDEEASTFVDIPGRHMGKADIVHPTLTGVRVEAFVTRSAADTQRICQAVEEMMA